MIHVLLATGLVGLAYALYGRASDLRFLGGCAACLALLIAMLAPGA